jgi:flagellar transcriptional activator FlhC
MKSPKGIITNNKEIEIAIQLINYGARMQMLESETQVNRNVLIKLHKEIMSLSPSKGLLPFSTDWYMVWENNIHSSIFYNIYNFLISTDDLTRVEVIIKSYQLYLEQCKLIDEGPSLLSITRAWMLIKFVDSNVLQLSSCSVCNGSFITHSYKPLHDFLCSFCHTPSRAVKL